MRAWLKLSLLLSTFGFLKEFRPSEYFMYDFLIGPWRNLTKETINEEVYPILTYSYVAQLFIVFLITDLCRYKLLIITLGVSGIIAFSMLLWTTSLFALQIIEVVYGTMQATEVAYYTYIYAKVPKDHYQQVSGHARSGILIGRLLSSVAGQLLISYKVMNTRSLNYITLGALILGTIWACLLPPVTQSIYFHRSDTEIQQRMRQKWTNASKLLCHHFVSSYSITHVLKWSIWWSLATNGSIIVQTYIQPLWTVIDPVKGAGLYNGAVEAILTLFGTMGALLAGFIKTDWHIKGEFTLAACSLIEGGVLLVASQTTNLFVCYACYIVFGSLYHFMITVASAEIARHILEDSYGLVFGMNMFMALVVQTILIQVIVSDGGFHLGVRDQFVFHGGYFMFMGGAFILMGIIEWVKFNREHRSNVIEEIKDG